jgi:hypothetical protein
MHPASTLVGPTSDAKPRRISSRLSGATPIPTRSIIMMRPNVQNFVSSSTETNHPEGEVHDEVQT